MRWDFINTHEHLHIFMLDDMRVFIRTALARSLAGFFVPPFVF